MINTFPWKYMNSAVSTCTVTLHKKLSIKSKAALLFCYEMQTHALIYFNLKILIRLNLIKVAWNAKQEYQYYQNRTFKSAI